MRTANKEREEARELDLRDGGGASGAAGGSGGAARGRRGLRRLARVGGAARPRRSGCPVGSGHRCLRRVRRGGRRAAHGRGGEDRREGAGRHQGARRGICRRQGPARTGQAAPGTPDGHAFVLTRSGRFACAPRVDLLGFCQSNASYGVEMTR